MELTNVSIPSPTEALPHFAALPDHIQRAIAELSRPFRPEDVRVRPGAIRRDGTAALALPYGDWWTRYLQRLNEVLGPNTWTIDLQPWGEHQVIARLVAFGGLIQGTSSGSGKGEANSAQEAEAQAKKRVVAEKLGLGLFFYHLPNVWGKGQRSGKEFYFDDGEEQRCVHEMYRRAGLLNQAHAGIDLAQQPPAPARKEPAQPRSTPERTPQPAGRTPAHPAQAAPSRGPARSPSSSGTVQPERSHSSAAPVSAQRPDPERIATARAALAQVEQSTGLAQRVVTAITSDTLATEAQLGKIVALVVQHPASNRELDHLGKGFGIAALSTLERKNQLRNHTPPLTRRQASTLIQQLLAQPQPAEDAA